ncbi:hypothetical protein EYF80_038563 [Liparis tanakae]|uniref:Uncharacterized protein n=1 Tax=Liparis tanakae TaxID=230148 RepID=A0A4Z2GEC3_9TELE|nr:hypothetical protein EYF80_038563 [Liparis tanakae]
MGRGSLSPRLSPSVLVWSVLVWSVLVCPGLSPSVLDQDRPGQTGTDRDRLGHVMMKVMMRSSVVGLSGLDLVCRGLSGLDLVCRGLSGLDLICRGLSGLDLVCRGLSGLDLNLVLRRLCEGLEVKMWGCHSRHQRATGWTQTRVGADNPVFWFWLVLVCADEKLMS